MKMELRPYPSYSKTIFNAAAHVFTGQSADTPECPDTSGCERAVDGTFGVIANQTASFVVARHVNI
jgi:hypothetical protein